MSELDNNPTERKGAVLARYPGQRILIGDSIIVRIAKIEGSRVFVHVEANADVNIARPPKEEDQRDKNLGARSQNTSTQRNLKD
jgi:sRNA-binding carbon storage regulator CsrA